MNRKPLFSVIIPTFHRNDLLTKCLECLSPGVQTLSAEQYEVIVSDDGVKSTAEQMIREQYPWVKWMSGPQKGPAANRNNGAKYSNSEWLVFTDDDCLPDPQWLDSYTKAITDLPNYYIFEGRTYVDRSRRSLAESAPINETGGYLWSCNFCIQKIVFEYLNGFDERFPYSAMEDVDLRLRLEKKGYHFFFIKNASVCHSWILSGGWKKLKQHQKSTLIYLSLHPEECKRINAVCYLQAAIRRFIKSTLPGIFKFKACGIIHEFLWHISCLQMAWLLAIKYRPNSMLN